MRISRHASASSMQSSQRHSLRFRWVGRWSLGFQVDADVLLVMLAIENVGVGVAGVAGDNESASRKFLAGDAGSVRVFGGADAELENGIAALLGGGAAHDHGDDWGIGEQVAEEIALVQDVFPALLVGGLERGKRAVVGAQGDLDLDAEIVGAGENAGGDPALLGFSQGAVQPVRRQAHGAREFVVLARDVSVGGDAGVQGAIGQILNELAARLGLGDILG